MLIKPNARFFVRNELVLRPQRDFGEPLPLLTQGRQLDALSVLEDAVEAGTATMTIEDEDVVTLTHIKVAAERDVVTLLFRRSDPAAPAPVFEDRRSRRKSLRASDKQPHEAEAVSAHMFVRLEPLGNKVHPTYPVVIEEMTGLGRSYIQGILRTTIGERKYSFKDDREQEHETYTITEVQGVPSETIGEALREGEIKHVELVRPPNVNGLDTSGLIPHPERMRLTVKATSRSAMLDRIERVRNWGRRHHWPTVRVRVATEDGRSRTIDIRAQDAADVLFVKAELVETRRALPQCTDSVNIELLAHARSFFANWG